MLRAAGCLAVGMISLALIAAAPPAGKAAAPPSAKAAGAATAAASGVTPLSHIEERGNGPITLILVPGLSCDWSVYDTFMARNASKYRMLAVTLPGFGCSNPPPLADGSSPMDGAWLKNAQAAILKLIDDRKLEKPVIIGHSMGGNLALQFAANHPDRIKAAISIDGLPVFPPPQPGQPDTREARTAMVGQFTAMMKSMPDESWPAGQKQSVKMLVTNPDRAKEIGEICALVPKDTTMEYMLEMVGSDLRPLLPGMKAPVLVISAVSDEMGEAMAANMRKVVADEFKGASPSVKLITFEDSRHFIMDDHPEALDKAIAAFLAGEKVEDFTFKRPTITTGTGQAPAGAASPR
jgi:pimeloyl-ACP methyl ester carboxylesterase